MARSASSLPPWLAGVPERILVLDSSKDAAMRCAHSALAILLHGAYVSRPRFTEEWVVVLGASAMGAVVVDRGGCGIQRHTLRRYSSYSAPKRLCNVRSSYSTTNR